MKGPHQADYYEAHRLRDAGFWVVMRCNQIADPRDEEGPPLDSYEILLASKKEEIARNYLDSLALDWWTDDGMIYMMKPLSAPTFSLGDIPI